MFHKIYSTTSGRNLLALSLAILLLMAGALTTALVEAAPHFTPTPTPTGPTLTIPSGITAYETISVTVPISFSGNGKNIAATTFSVDYDQACLSFNPSDDDSDGIPDAISFNVPNAFNGSVTFDQLDGDSELDFLIADIFPPLASLPDGTLAEISFTATCAPTVSPAVNYSTAPSPSFGSTTGSSVSGSTINGSVQIVPPPTPEVQIDQIIPNPAKHGETVEFNGGGTTQDIQITLQKYEWSLLEVGESCGSVSNPYLLGNKARLLINSIPEGEHRVCLRGENIADVWSDYATTTITIQPDRWAESDIAVSRDSISFWKDDQATLRESNPNIGDDVYVKIWVDNIGIHQTTDEVTISLYEGYPVTGTLLATETIDFIAAEQNDYVLMPWKVGHDGNGNPIPGYENGYTVVGVDLEYTDNIPYFANDPLPPYPEPHIENRYDNNQATAPIAVGPPIFGQYDIDVTTDISPIGQPDLYAGYPANLFGDARYAFGSQIPTMGAETTIEITALSDGTPHGNYQVFTTAPLGRYISTISLPTEPGDYRAIIRVNDNNLVGATYINFTVLESPEPLPDLYVEWLSGREGLAVNLAGDDVYQRSWHTYPLHRVYYHTQLYGVLNEAISIEAVVRNKGNLDATSFNVSFYDGKPGAGGILLGTESVTGLAQGTSTTVDFNWTPTEEKKYVIQVVVDEADDVTEKNEINNYDSYYYKHQTWYHRQSRTHRDIIEIRAANPDLRALNLTPRREPNLNEVTNMTVEIHNIGHADISAQESFEVTLYDGYPGVADTRILAESAHLGQPRLNGPLTQGDKQVVDVEWDTRYPGTEPGLHHICVEVDRAQEITEEFDHTSAAPGDAENNVNCWNFYVFPLEVDLYPTNITFSNYAPLPNEEITINATIQNLGAIASNGTEEVNFYQGHPNQGGTLIGSTTLTGSIPGRRGTSTASIQWTTPDSHGSTYIYAEYVKEEGYKPGTRLRVRRLDVKAFPPPNLRVRSDDIDLTEDANAGNYRVSADISNIATANNNSTTATDFNVRFYTDGPNAGLAQLGSTIVVSSLAKGDTITIEANDLFIPVDPYYVIKVEAIPSVEQGDKDYRDNEATTSIGIDFLVTNDGPAPRCGTITFTTANAPNHENIAFAWDFGDGSPVESDDDGIITHAYSEPGDYTVTVTTQNTSPELTTTTTVTVLDTDCAISDLSASYCPAILNPGDQATLKAVIAAGSNVTYDWDFGDGNTATGAEVTHTYTALGSYNATVTATNSVSSASETIAIDVTERLGDANGDGKVDAGDITALILEILDGDGNDPADTPGGTFPGNPNADANQDGIVDVGDLNAIILITFNTTTCD